jgi:hypothetical protein
MTQSRLKQDQTKNNYLFLNIEIIKETPRMNRDLYNLSYTNSYNISENESFLPELRNNVKKLNSYKKLEANWNLSNAEPFTEELIDKIISELSNLETQPKVFPTGRNSIQLEYEKQNGDYLEFEIFENKINYLLIKNNVEKEELINFEKINQLVKEFYA